MPQRSLTAAIRLIVILAIFVSALLQPPGTMIARAGEAITYVLCTGGELKTMTVTLPGEEEKRPGREPNSCDFFAAQVAALPLPVLAPLTTANPGKLVHMPLPRTTQASGLHRPANGPRAPPIPV